MTNCFVTLFRLKIHMILFLDRLLDDTIISSIPDDAIIVCDMCIVTGDPIS